MNPQALQSFMKAQADNHCMTVPEHTIQVGDTLYLIDLHDVTPREAVYQENPEQNTYQLVGASCILHTSDECITSTHEMMRHLAESAYSVMDIVCISLTRPFRCSND